ncbi:MAG: LacI family DNA-binding transcriptional regulator [Rhodoglobus sp.]
MSALSDVARIAGVSKATASRALSGNGYVSDDTRDRVVSAAAQIGYVVSSTAQSLVTGQTRNVGVVIPYLNRWYFAEVLDGIESALIAAGYDLTLYRLSPDAVQRRRVFEYFLVRKRVDAVIAVGIELTPHEIEMLSGLGKPIAGIGGPIDGIATLSIDDVETARLATDHIISLGHTRIMHLGGDQDLEMDFHVHSQRLTGFLEALRSAGLDESDAFRTAPVSIQGGYAVALTVLADPRARPTAIVAGCDEVAIGALIAARQLGIQVPSQLSVIGIDGHDLADMFGLTTLAQNPKAQGVLAVELLMAELADTGTLEEPGWRAYPVALDVRTSTTAPAEV